MQYKFSELPSNGLIKSFDACKCNDSVILDIDPIPLFNSSEWFLKTLHNHVKDVSDKLNCETVVIKGNIEYHPTLYFNKKVTTASVKDKL